VAGRQTQEWARHKGRTQREEALGPSLPRSERKRREIQPRFAADSPVVLAAG
jgi:hypothetical protein